MSFVIYIYIYIPQFLICEQCRQRLKHLHSSCASEFSPSLLKIIIAGLFFSPNFPTHLILKTPDCR